MSSLRHIYFILIFMLIAVLAIKLFIPISLWVPVILILCIVGLLGYGSFNIQAGFFVKTHNNPNHNRPEIAITFDDGPSKFTSEILDILKEANAKATFFCIGKHIEEQPELVRRILDEGHAVGNHTYSHSTSLPFFSRKRISNELRKTSSLISNLSQKPVSLFRPPFGVTNPAIVKAAKENKLEIIGWNLRSLDGTKKNSEQILQRILPRIEAGTVLLLHDTRPDSGAMLREVLRVVRSKKLKPVIVNQQFDLNEAI